MSDYPAEESTPFIDYLDMDHSLPTKLIETRDKLTEVASRDRRRDEAIVYLEWTLVNLPAQYAAILTPAGMLQMLGEINMYAVVGSEAPWIKAARVWLERS